MMDVSQKPNHTDSGGCIHAGTCGFSHQNRCGMDSGNLAGTTHHRHHHYGRHSRYPYLEAQA